MTTDAVLGSLGDNLSVSPSSMTELPDSIHNPHLHQFTVLPESLCTGKVLVAVHGGSCDISTKLTVAARMGTEALFIADADNFYAGWWTGLCTSFVTESRAIPCVAISFVEYSTVSSAATISDNGSLRVLIILDDPSGFFILVPFAWPFVFVALFEVSAFLKRKQAGHVR
ncbi:hypothetical protein BC830DRAFT_1169642 [Chytriomyces sp. MP71]|nr:hypothetical protein BC830DRAFT_1169642 [Chytriomyces sp. MP71]